MCACGHSVVKPTDPQQRSSPEANILDTLASAALWNLIHENQSRNYILWECTDVSVHCQVNSKLETSFTCSHLITVMGFHLACHELDPTRSSLQHNHISFFLFWHDPQSLWSSSLLCSLAKNVAVHHHSAFFYGVKFTDGRRVHVKIFQILP